MPTAAQETQRPDYIAEVHYLDLPINVHQAVNAITYYGTIARGGDFRVDDVDESTLRTANRVLQSNIGNSLPQMGINEERVYGECGQTPDITEGHANFEIVGDFFDGPTGSQSIFLRVPQEVSSDFAEIAEAESTEDESLWPLSKEGTIRLGAISLMCVGVAVAGGISIAKNQNPYTSMSLILVAIALQMTALTAALSRGEATERGEPGTWFKNQIPSN